VKDLILAILFYLAMMVLLIFLWPSPAHSQVSMVVPIHCTNGKIFIEMLGRKYSEKLAGSGFTDGMLAQLYLSKTKGWTIIILNPNGMACTIAAGTDWETVVIIEGEPS
jgi:hypothetical protein